MTYTQDFVREHVIMTEFSLFKVRLNKTYFIEIEN